MSSIFKFALVIFIGLVGFDSYGVEKLGVNVTCHKVSSCVAAATQCRADILPASPNYFRVSAALKFQDRILCVSDYNGALSEYFEDRIAIVYSTGESYICGDCDQRHMDELISRFKAQCDGVVEDNLTLYSKCNTK